MVYLAAVIDWYSKAVLSWSISNTMDTDLVMGVLNNALNNYDKPEIFNTDQKERLHQSLDYATPNEVYFKGANSKVFDDIDLLLKVA